MALKDITSLYFIHFFSYLDYFRLVFKWKKVNLELFMLRVFISTFSIPINFRLTL